MTDHSTKQVGVTIGIDLGDRHSHLCVLDGEGQIIEEGRVVTNRAAFERRFAGEAPARIAFETGTHSPWVLALLTELGHQVIVANPRKLRMIFKSDSKNDRVDAQQLARVARLDPQLLSPIQHRSQEVRADLHLLRSRDVLVATRTKMVNHIRGCMKGFGLRLPCVATTTFPRVAAPMIPRNLRSSLVPMLRMIAELTTRIRDSKRRIERLCAERYPQTEVLRQVNGVGPVTALTFMLTLEDPSRFAKSRDVGAYLGIRPKQRQSGHSDPELRISKAGDRELRRLLVQCAQYMLGPFGKDSDLRRFGLRLAARGGASAKRRAIIAVARKLAVLLHRLWVTGEVYEPLRQASLRAPGMESTREVARV